MAKANGKAPFLDRKLKHAPHNVWGYGTSTVPASEPDTAREALETLKQIVHEWLYTVTVAATSDARSVIPTICMDLEQLVETTVQAVLTGTWTGDVDRSDYSWKELQAAGEAVTLDSGNWDDWMQLDAAATLFRAAIRGRGIQAARQTEEEAVTQH